MCIWRGVDPNTVMSPARNEYDKRHRRFSVPETATRAHSVRRIWQQAVCGSGSVGPPKRPRTRAREFPYQESYIRCVEQGYVRRSNIAPNSANAPIIYGGGQPVIRGSRRVP